MRYEWLRPFAQNPRHIEVLDALSDGRTVVSAAQEVGITERNVYEKIKEMKTAAANKARATTTPAMDSALPWP